MTGMLALGLVGAFGAGLLALASLADPAAALQGWMVAVIAWIGVPLGSLALLLAHALTGGEWGRVLRPILLPATALVLPAAVAMAILGSGLDAVSSWGYLPAAAPPDVAGLYLNGPGLLARSAIALGGWSIIAHQLKRGPSNGLAAAGLVFVGVTASAFAVDWVLSVDPRYQSSALPATFIVEKILTALALCAVLLPPDTDEKDCADLAALLLSALLGLVYLELMTFIVAWYGNLPDKAAWFLHRSTRGWALVLAAAFALGALAPATALMWTRVRRGRKTLALVGSLVLGGVLLHSIWLIAPAYGWQAAVLSLPGALCLGSLTLLVVRSRPAARSSAHA